MTIIRNIMLYLAFLAVCMGGTGCFFSMATLNNLGETRWRYSTYSTELSPDESEVITKYRKKTEHDCWPFLTAWHVTWNTNSFVEERAPFEKPDGEDVDLNLYRPQSRSQHMGAGESTGPVGYCWKALWLPPAFVTDVVLLPVYGIVLYIFAHELGDALGHGQ